MKTEKDMIENVFRRKSEYERNAKARKAAIFKITSSVCCVCLVAALLLSIGTGLFSNEAEAVGYKVMLDVNPSIEVAVNREDRIIQVNDLNEDGTKVIGDKGLAGQEVAEGVGKLITEMVDGGYISKEANSVLVTIEGTEKEKTDKIKEELTEKISEQLTEKDVEGSIIVQELPDDNAALKDTSAEYGISPGKAQLIAQIIAQNSLHSYDELAAMTIHQLDLLRKSYYVNPENVQVSGTPSDMAYIGEQKAIQIAVADAQVDNPAAEVEFTCRDGVMLYCVEFENDTFEYRYRINAVTGEILTAEKIELGKESFVQSDTAIATVGENAALNAALAHAGIENGKLIRCKYKTDWVDGTVIYDLYFTDGRNSGSYVINARTGEIIKYGKTQEPRDRSVAAALIGEAEAKRIALAKDGLVDGNVTKYEMVLQKNGDAYVYDMMYICNATKYTVQVSAADGQILAFEKVVLRDTGAPSVETDKTPSQETGAPDAEEGSRPSVEDGNRPSSEEGNRPSAEEGSRPSAEG